MKLIKHLANSAAIYQTDRGRRLYFPKPYRMFLFFYHINSDRKTGVKALKIYQLSWFCLIFCSFKGFVEDIQQIKMFLIKFKLHKPAVYSPFHTSIRLTLTTCTQTHMCPVISLETSSEVSVVVSVAALNFEAFAPLGFFLSSHCMS